jgi:hypothetical protein
MKFYTIVLLTLIAPVISNAQVPVSSGVFDAKDFSKEIALFKAKQFVIESVLGVSGEVFQFEIDPLAAASSGELTSLVYQSPDKGKEGLVLGFYGDYWNPAGVVFKGFAFKDIPKDRALLLLDTLQKTIDGYSKFLNEDRDNNNVYFQAEGMTFLVFYSGLSIKIRVFWKDFDSEWDMVAFRRTKRRLLHKLSDS